MMHLLIEHYNWNIFGPGTHHSMGTSTLFSRSHFLWPFSVSWTKKIGERSPFWQCGAHEMCDTSLKTFGRGLGRAPFITTVAYWVSCSILGLGQQVSAQCCCLAVWHHIQGVCGPISDYSLRTLFTGLYAAWGIVTM